MKFDVFEDMYKMLWDFIYAVLEKLGIVAKNEEGNLEDVEAAE